jgi:Protein phosphatase 2C
MPEAAPNLVWTAYLLPKHGHSEAEREDACAGDPRTGRFAVADGASESAFARPWAEALAHAHVAYPGPWSAGLPVARADWQQRFEGKAMPWYVEAKFQEGAFATLLGLALERNAGRLAWLALAVGDSCLFQVREDSLRRAFPVKRAADFDHRPALIGSRAPLQVSPRCKRRRARGTWRPGDVFLLMTDALAEWFLRAVEGCG